VFDFGSSGISLDRYTCTSSPFTSSLTCPQHRPSTNVVGQRMTRISGLVFGTSVQSLQKGMMELMQPYTSQMDVARCYTLQYGGKIGLEEVHSTHQHTTTTRTTYHITTTLQLHTTHYTTHYTLHTTTHYTLHTTHYTLHTTHYTLHTTHYTLHTTHYTLHATIHYNTLHTTAHYTRVHCTTQHTTHNTQHTTHNTQHNTQQSLTSSLVGCT